MPSSDPIFLLDHGFVRYVDHMGSDLAVVRNARQSYDAQWRAGEDEGSDAKLIRYLMKNHHDTPFESVEIQFEVHAPIFVFRQWHRHRTWSYNELSGRYKELPREFFLPNPTTVGYQAKVNKQGRQEDHSEELILRRSRQVERIRAHSLAGFDLYDELLADGWPRELARAHLGLNTYSNMFAKVNLRNLFHFLSLRTDPHAQKEIQVYAFAMLNIAHQIAPVCVRAWEELRNA